MVTIGRHENEDDDNDDNNNNNNNNNNDNDNDNSNDNDYGTGNGNDNSNGGGGGNGNPDIYCSPDIFRKSNLKFRNILICSDHNCKRLPYQKIFTFTFQAQIIFIKQISFKPSTIYNCI